MSDTIFLYVTMLTMFIAQIIIIYFCLNRISEHLAEEIKKPEETEKHGGFSKELQLEMIELDKLGKKMLDKLKKQREGSK